MNYFCGAEEKNFFFFRGGGHGSNYFNPVMKHRLKVFMSIINSCLFKLFNATTLGLEAKFPLSLKLTLLLFLQVRANRRCKVL